MSGVGMLVDHATHSGYINSHSNYNSIRIYTT